MSTQGFLYEYGNFYKIHYLGGKGKAVCVCVTICVKKGGGGGAVKIKVYLYLCICLYVKICFQKDQRSGEGA